MCKRTEDKRSSRSNRDKDQKDYPQGFKTVHARPDTQTLSPVKPIPPHCAQAGCSAVTLAASVTPSTAENAGTIVLVALISDCEIGH